VPGISSDATCPCREREYRTGLERALTAGYEILKRGGSSLDCNGVRVRVLEDIHILRRQRLCVYKRWDERDGRIHHGRKNARCRRGRFVEAHQKSDQSARW